MKIKRSINNIIVEFIYSTLIIIINFIIRKVIISNIGIELIGLTSVLNQIITVLQLAELGMSSVMMYYLYKPLEKNNTKKIVQIMSLFKKLYHYVCLIIVVIGIGFIPFLKLFIKDYTLSINYLYVYILLLIQTSSTYLFSYKMLLMKADQKEYKYKRIHIVLKLITFIIELFILMKNYYIYLIVNIVDTLLINIIISRYVNKNYPYLNNKDELNKEEKKKIEKDIKNTFISRISGVVTNSSDTFIISIMSNVTVLGLYSNYFVIISALIQVVSKIFDAVQATLGSSIVGKSKYEIYNLYRRVSFVSFILALFGSISFYILIGDVINIWIGKNYILSNSISIGFTIQLFIMIYRMALWQFLPINGLFKVDKIAALVGSISNIIISIVLYIYIGLLGVIIGTITSQTIQYIIKIYNLRKYLEVKEKESLNFILFMIIFIFVIILKQLLKSIITFILVLPIVCILIILIYGKKYEYKYIFNVIKNIKNMYFTKKKI